MRVVSKIQMFFLGTIFLLINNICLADSIIDINNTKVKYYRWAMIDRHDRIPIFSATTTLKHIYNLNSKHEKNFYKAIYENDIIKKVSTYKKNKLVRIDYFDKDGMWLNYVKYNDNKEVECNINFDISKENQHIFTISCADKSKKIIIYIYKEWTDSQKEFFKKHNQDKKKRSNGYWSMYKVVKYKNLKQVFKQVIVDSTCFNYDNKDKLISKSYCSEYEHTKPMDNAVWSMVPMW